MESHFGTRIDPTATGLQLSPRGRTAPVAAPPRVGIGGEEEGGLGEIVASVCLRFE